MVRFLVRRVFQVIPLFVAISVVVFLLIHAVPGGLLVIYLANPNVRFEDIERLRCALGLDRSLWEQYWTWFAAFVRGDWGYSFSDGWSVIARVVERLSATMELIGVVIAVALALMIPIGIAVGAKSGRWFDRIAMTVCIAGISLLAFWFGLLLQIVFALMLGWLSSSGRITLGVGDFVDRVLHFVMSAMVLAVVLVSGWMWYLCVSMIEIFGWPFVVVARGCGVFRWRVLLRYVLCNAVGSVVVVVIIDAVLLIGGAIVMESVFVWSGLGSLFTEVLVWCDYIVLMVLLLLVSAVVVVLNIVVDVAHVVFDV